MQNLDAIRTRRGSEDGQQVYWLSIKGTSELFTAKKQGRKWACNGRAFKSLRCIKQAILAGQLSEPAASDDAEPEPADGTWDCVEPGAWLVLLLDEFGIHKLPLSMISDIELTLDSTGWLNDEGEHDVARAHRVVNGYLRRQEGATA